jgi:hypothetical protein
VFLVDDNFNSHPKVMSIPRRDRIAAGGLWLFAGVWCRRHLTDGFVPKYMLSEFGAKPSTASTLCEAKLWTVVADGYQFVDWSQWQDTKEDVQTKREQWRKRQVKHRTEKDVTRDKSVTPEPVTRDSHADVTPVTRSLPVPYPIPNPSLEDKDSSSSAVADRRPDPFDEFWRTYPRRVGKDAAKKAWGQAAKRADVACILAGARRFAEDPNREPQFTAHPATWLNQGRWDDDPLPPRVNGHAKPSTTDERVRQGLDLTAKYLNEERQREEIRSIGPAYEDQRLRPADPW